MATMPLYPDAKHSNSFEVGAEFTDFVVDALSRRGLYLQMYTSRKYQFSKGESLQGWEVKLDNRFTDTGRLSIEVAEKTNASVPTWTPSGIFRADNTIIYIQGNYQYFFLFFKKHLAAEFYAKDPNDPNIRRYKVEEMPTIQKFYIPIDRAEKLGIKIIP